MSLFAEYNKTDISYVLSIIFILYPLMYLSDSIYKIPQQRAGYHLVYNKGQNNEEMMWYTTCCIYEVFLNNSFLSTDFNEMRIPEEPIAWSVIEVRYLCTYREILTEKL